ncbi:hypothetical protein [Pseudorhodoplanes sp.]|uniref:hypothetical protein n=1 Tax=Pseudorhodoplanes sp. TaxID=1934341 RepID=UPI002CC1B644|nr:hypothetical protein [Pseudorhodoplanes sp.]HWV55717.1 hypothetical protein [Pseudorhodoplanes sp.]
MHGKAPLIILVVSLLATVPYGASASPLVAGGNLAVTAETLTPVESVHYYGYGRGYYGYGRGYYGYGGGYYGRGYYGRGYYGGYYPYYGRGYGYRYY